MGRRTTVVGIDENGLGPRLGPLVVTGVRLRLRGDPPPVERLRAETGLDDSKKVFSPARRGRGEALALGVIAAAGLGLPERYGRLLERIALPSPFPPKGACGGAAAARLGRCVPLGDGPALPRWAAAPAGLSEPLGRLGVAIDRVASIVLCPGALNDAIDAGRSKLDIDLALFEAVGEALAAEAGGAEVVCGKVGGTNRYRCRFTRWPAEGTSVEVESRARSAYRVPGIGRVVFERDADAGHSAVAIASVVGKYVRELWMDGLAKASGWSGEAPSGYHDPVTARFVDATAGRLAGPGGVLPHGDCLVRRR
jgi:ribonuclease HII